jgi:hypothetical protein
MADCLLHASLGSISGAKDAPKYRIHFAAHSSAQRLTVHLIVADCRRPAGRGDRADPSANQFRRQLRQPIELILRPSVIDRDVLTFDIARVFESLAECAQTVRVVVRRCGTESPDHWHRRLLRPRGNRPHSRRPA